MDYKKKYEEAERLYRTANADQRYVLESLFPELKESEDEKIRKELIDIVAKSPITFAFEDKNKVLSWLEKQGVQKPQGKSAIEAIKEERVDNANKVEPKDYSSIDPHFGKPVDKIEPKFKV